MRRAFWAALTFLPLLACGSANEVGGPPDPPETPNLPEEPSTPAPTGQTYDVVVGKDACGHKGIYWVLVDEMCGNTDDPNYTDRFRAPMFRDGAVIGDALFAVDGTHLWTLDVSVPESPPRKSLIAGVGTPIGAAAHGADLLLAAGDEGLIVMDVSDPTAPVRKHAVLLGGPALRVTVTGDLAYVPTGGAGVAVVDLAADPPVLVKEIAIPGFAASVKVEGSLAYVAACDTVAIVDLGKDEVVSEVWYPTEQAYVNDVLVAPAKDIEVRDGVAFVAAGRYGAVAIDVSDPIAPQILGNCTIEDDLGFYASGVRSKDGDLFVAGGEWGILPLSVAEAKSTCATATAPKLPEIPDPDGGDGDCSPVPPWEVVDWTQSYSPPPPGKDPIQTLPVDGTLYAFGDARRNALRAIDLREIGTPDLAQIGRYEEPRRVTALAAKGGRIVATGPGGGVFDADATSLLKPVEGALLPPEEGIAIAILDDLRWVVTTETDVYVEGAMSPEPLSGRVWPDGLAAGDKQVFIAEPSGVRTLDVTTGLFGIVPFEKNSQLPAALEVTESGLVLAAPEWTAARKHTLEGALFDLSPHGVFSEEDVKSIPQWQRGVPHRMLVGTTDGLVEIATLGSRAGMFLHATNTRIELPAGEYRTAAATGNKVYLVTANRGTYRSAVLSIDVGGDDPGIAAIDTFTGVATGVAADGDRLYVADGDKGIRVYDRSGEDLLLLGTVDGGAEVGQ